jgi:hypothetical protein
VVAFDAGFDVEVGTFFVVVDVADDYAAHLHVALAAAVAVHVVERGAGDDDLKPLAAEVADAGKLAGGVLRGIDLGDVAVRRDLRLGTV